MPNTVSALDFERFQHLLLAVHPVSLGEARALFAHYSLLLRWNRVLNLTRIEDIEDAVERHYGEALFLADLLPSGALTVADIGSGGGFPGIPLAVRRPECRVTLVESHQRKAVFLREASRELPTVSVLAVRADQLPLEADWVVARAVRWQDVVPAAHANVALLLGDADAAAASQDERFAWEPPLPLPSSKRRVLLTGQRIR
ncbi:MAG TPA: 16S rRNA (guanine(527)-N(7))-methyltransferase RsmG [Bryobacteraceae bacterium]|nr:16S rRNA (guanine(527)-N(7))-methyltransferase RsmG [Bryobacteraceae bacterium]